MAAFGQENVPCQSCCLGYDGPHRCESREFCPCDQPTLHPRSEADVVDEFTEWLRAGLTGQAAGYMQYIDGIAEAFKAGEL